MSKILSYFLQRFSLHDGNGIRTNIFLKGCSLSCKWCQNPESIQKKIEMSFDKNKCISCLDCRDVCDEDAIDFTSEERINFEECTSCGECAKVCCNGAIEQIGRYYNAEELYEELVKDKCFFDVSGGGVTFTGGEPLLQSRALIPLLKMLQKEGIHMLFESCGGVPWSNFEDVLDFADEFFIDVKASPELHKQLTGVSQKGIINNIEKLLKTEKKVTFRMPVVPGYNDGEDCIKGIADTLNKLKKNEITLLQYHRMYENKIDKLNTDQEKLEISPEEDSIENVKEIFEKYEIKVNVPEKFESSELDKSVLSERVWKFKKEIQEFQTEICTDRVNLYTEYCLFFNKFLIFLDKNKENEDKHPLIKRAEVLSFFLKNKTNKIYPNEVLVGSHTSHRVGGPIYMDLHGIGIIQDMFKFNKRKHIPVKISGKQKLDLIKSLYYWFTRNVVSLSYEQKIFKILKKAKQFSNGDEFFLNEVSGFGHLNPDYESLLAKGTQKIKKEAKEKKKQTDDIERKLFYESVIIMCNGMEEFAQIYVEIAKEQAKDPDISDKRRKELEKIAEVCEKVPKYPAKTFHEALQTIMFYHIGIMNEALDNGIAPGRLDYILLPYYENDKKNGVSDSQITELIGLFFIKLNEFIPIFNKKTDDVHGGLFSDVQNLLRLRQPNFYARIHEESPKEYIQEIAQMLLDGATTPALSNDKSIIPQLVDRGMSLEHARDYILLGCVEPVSCGRTYGSTDASLNNLSICFERALGLKDGKCFMPYSAVDCLTVDEFYDLFVLQLDDMLEDMFKDQVLIEKSLQENFPTPLTSLCLEGCLESGRDASVGGVLYNSSGDQAVGVPDLADSFAAIEENVFQKKLFTMVDLINALRNNFEGEKNNRIKSLCLNSPKYGNDNKFVDKWFERILKTYSDIITRHFNLRGGKHLAGHYSVTVHKAFGLKTGALPRLAGKPLATGLSNTNGSDLNGPTSIINSVTSFDITPYCGNGINFNITLDTSYLEGEQGLKAVQGLFQGCFKNNGMQIQFNVMDPKILVEAKKNPDAYPNLLVRVSGYSAYFKDLEPLVQQEIIDRYLGYEKANR